MSTVQEAEGGYQLTLSPASYYEQRGTSVTPSCVLCNEELETVDEFSGTGQHAGFFYTGSLMVCPDCGHVHYIVDRTSNISGPVTLQWQ